MSAISIIQELNDYGADVFLDNGCLKLGIRQGCPVPEAVIAKAKQHKAELLSALSPTGPAVWDVVVMTNNKHSRMVVIDPHHSVDDEFMSGLRDRFGSERIISARRRLKAKPIKLNEHV